MTVCANGGKPIVFEPYFLDGKPGPNPPIWFHPPGVLTCNLPLRVWPRATPAEGTNP